MEYFKELPDNTRIWIYQSNRQFSEQETLIITQKIADFVRSWNSHGAKVTADGALVYNRFVVLAVDESQVNVSGCSIDSSVALVRALADQFQVDFFDRFNIAYKQSGTIESAGRDEFQQLLENGTVNENTIVFNNLVNTKKDFLNRWEIPLKESWHHSFFAVS